MKNEYPIKVVEKITGLTGFVLRAWEKRYGVVSPTRTDTNRRVFSEEDIRKLVLLKKGIAKGYKISNLAAKSVSELEALLGEEELTTEVTVEKIDLSTKNYIENSLLAISELNAKAFEVILLRAFIQLPLHTFIDDFIIPFLNITGEKWASGELSIVHEHFASESLKSFLIDVSGKFHVPQGAPKILLSTPKGQLHEFGILLAQITAAAAGFEVVNLGINLPAEEVILAAQTLKPSALVLSIIIPTHTEEIHEELIKLKILPDDIKIIIGGKTEKLADLSDSPSRFVYVGAFNEFRHQLASIKSAVNY
jgi:MerR family transcriptional regulator, light-induced transcriptional regulator